MYRFYPWNIETVRALREVILSIIDTNLKEVEFIELQSKVMVKAISTFQKKVYFTNGIYIETKNNEMAVRLNVKVVKAQNLKSQLIELQNRIYNDIFQLTGFKISSVHISVNI